ncbi:DNA gyrase inhibitor YacG [Klebsiella pneumoniae]
MRCEQSPIRPFWSKRCQLIDLRGCTAEDKRSPSAEDLSDSDEWGGKQP